MIWFSSIFELLFERSKKPSNSWFRRPRSPRLAPIDEG
jgi:hypothetical protein